MIDGKHTNRFILVFLSNELKEMEENIMKYYNDYIWRGRSCDIIILCIDPPRSTKFHTIKLLGD